MPVIHIADKKNGLLSFRNLTELHVLSALRREYAVKLQAIRRAVLFLRNHFHTEHPLADRSIETDGVGIFIREFGNILNVSDRGQREMRQVIESFLKRIERDKMGNIAKLYPFTSTKIDTSKRAVVIDARLQFGRPWIRGTGIPTTILIERFTAGDKIEDLANDYKVDTIDIEEALRFEKIPA